MGNPGPFNVSDGDASLSEAEIQRQFSSEWEDVAEYRLQDYDVAHALTAILAHINCTLQTRWEPGKGTVWRCEPK